MAGQRNDVGRRVQPRQERPRLHRRRAFLLLARHRRRHDHLPAAGAGRDGGGEGVRRLLHLPQPLRHAQEILPGKRWDTF